MKLVIVSVLVLACLGGLGAYLYAPDKPRASLEALYAAPGEFIQVAGLRIHFRDTGPPHAAPVLIMLHGFGASLDTWEAWAKALSSDYRVVRFDLPGFGLTGPDPTGDYTDARTRFVLGALMDKLGIARATLVGNSLGGKIAWSFAAEHPERTAALVLVSPDGFASPGFEYGRKAEVPAMMRLLPYVLPEPMVRMTLAPAYANPALLTGPLVTRYRDMMLAPGVRRAMLTRMEQVRLQPPEPALRSIRVPTLLIWGERDQMIPFSNSADYLRLIPDCSLARLPDLGHVPQEEAPDRSLVPLRAFLDRTLHTGPAR